MFNKKLEKKVDTIKSRMEAELSNIDTNTSKLNNRINLLLEYLGLEVVTEKSVGSSFEHQWSGNAYLGFGTRDYVKYTEKIVKKVQPKKKK